MFFRCIIFVENNGHLYVHCNQTSRLLAVSSVFSKVRYCAVPSCQLRSEISFSRTYNNPNLISYIYCTALVMLASFTVCVSTWLRNCKRTETIICSVQNFLRGNTGSETDFLRLFSHFLRRQLHSNVLAAKDKEITWNTQGYSLCPLSARLWRLRHHKSTLVQEAT